MSVSYTSIGWNRPKRAYDAVMLGAMALYVAAFVGVGKALPAARNMSHEVLIIRSLGTLAILMLHVVLCIGPLARLDRRFLPILYNRRHLGVATFLAGLAHAIVSIGYYHGFGALNPFTSLLSSNTRFASLAAFPFELFGLVALVILFLMAATSHDFWLANLTPPIWKALHTLVYVAYALVVGHVLFGVLQAETSVVYSILLGLGILWILGLHLLAAKKERAVDLQQFEAAADGYVDVCAVNDIPEKCAKVVVLSGERVAIFKYDGQISAISNVCQHQNGPLGEGRIIDGLVTCPWHGFNYRPADGASPAPFTEKVPTFRVKVINRRVFVHPHPHLPGTFVEPAMIE